MNQQTELKYSRIVDFRLHDAFNIFIEKSEGTYFYIRGRGRTAHTAGEYLDRPVALRTMERLQQQGHKNRLGTGTP